MSKYLHVVIMTRKEFSTYDYIDVKSIRMIEDGAKVRIDSEYMGIHDYAVDTHDFAIMGVVNNAGENV